MNSCGNFQELISCRIDGEITQAESVSLEAHLKECPSCRSVLEIYQLISSEDELQEPPAELCSNVMAAIGAINKPKKKPAKIIMPRFLRYSAMAAACILLALLTIPRVISPTKSAPEAEYSVSYREADDDSANNECDFYATAGEGDNSLDAPMLGFAPDSAMSKRLGNFTAVVQVDGSLPAFLSDYIIFDNSDGTYNIYITWEEADTLENSGFPTNHYEGGSDMALVIYTPGESAN